MKKKEEVRQILENMSLEEKVAQMVQLTGDYFNGTGILTGPESKMDLTEDVVHASGSTLNVIGADTLYQVQKKYLETSPNGIPLMFMADVINGLKTVFPIPLAQGCSFDPELVKDCAGASARESAAVGLHLSFSPMADLCRDARWGRVMESTGEDVWLNCQMAKAMVEGYQGDGLDQPGTIAACVKHFAAYGAPEAGREYNSVDMSEKRLREEYFPAYKAGLDAGAAMIMASFNTLNGIPASGNEWLNRKILREEWGYDGVLISDYSSVNELIAHGVAENEEEAAELAIKAGVDIDMVSPVYAKNLVRMVKEGKVLQELVDEGVLRILNLKNQLGLLDNPYRFDEEQREMQKQWIGCSSHKELAEKMALESMVLLKNNGVLPLKNEEEKIALIGPFADTALLCGSWSLFYDKDDVCTLDQGFSEIFGSRFAGGAKGSCLLGEEDVLMPFRGAPILGKDEHQGRTDEEFLEEAVALAKKADIAVLTLGEHPQQSGEGAAKTDLTLQERQLKLFEAVSAVCKKVVVVLFAGRPMDLRAVQKADAILAAWFPGTEGGRAVAKILSGQVSPSGKLAMSFPYCTGQEPLCYSHYRTGRPEQIGTKSPRFTSNYQDAPRDPLYPFGHGLSYTEFSCYDIGLDKDVMEENGVIVVSGIVENKGEITGTETILCFVQDVKGSTARPVRELKGMSRITLEPGEKQTFSIRIEEKDLRFYRADGSYGTEPGLYRVYIGDQMESFRRV